VKHGLRLVFSSEWAKFALLIAAATAVHWLGGTSERMLEHALHHGLEWNWHDPALLAASLALLCLIWQIWRLSREHSGVIVRRLGEARACPNLVLFLSPPYAGRPEEAEKEALLHSLQGAEVNLQKPDWCPSLLTNSPWHMPLEAIAHHARLAKASGKQLLSVHVIVSHQTNEYVELFRQLVERGLGQDKLLIPAPRAINFEDFHEVSEAVNDVIKELKATADDRFLMDITGGSKICSVVAAALCFEEGRRVQYVHGQAGYRVAEYDLRYLAPEFLRPGA